MIGLTGGIATGKSTVSGLLRSLGVPVIDADELAREVVGPGTFGLRSIVEVFGPDMISQGSLDRKKIAEKVFSDPQARLTLERITHPLIQWRALQEKDVLRTQKHPLIFYDAALIFEKNLVKDFDAIVVVHTTEAIQKERLALRDKISIEEIERRMKAQMPVSDKMKLAHFLIDNTGTIENTKRQITDLVDNLTKLASEDD